MGNRAVIAFGTNKRGRSGGCMPYQLRSDTASGAVIDCAETHREALDLARFYAEDPRDADAPQVIFVFDTEARQFVGWYRRREKGRQP